MVKAAPVSASYAGVESAQDAISGAIERDYDVLVDVSCASKARTDVAAALEARGEGARPFAAVVCGAGGVAESAMLEVAAETVSAAAGGDWAAVYVGARGAGAGAVAAPGAAAPAKRGLRDAEDVRVRYTAECDQDCRTKVSAIEALLVVLVVLAFLYPGIRVMYGAQTPTRFEKPDDHRD